MKIMMVHHFGQIGGGTNSCFDICRMLVEDAHDVVVAIPNPSDPVIQMARDINIRLIATPVKAVCLSCHNADSGTAKMMIKFALSARNIAYWKQLFQNEKPDLIMLNSSVQGPLVRLAHQLGFKTICFIRETVREKGMKFWKNVNKRMLSLADGLAFLTNHDMKTWEIPYCDKQTVIPDIVDEKRFNLNTNLSDHTGNDCNLEAKYLLYLGGFSEEKGALDLLRAFHVCARRNGKLHLIILGDTNGQNYEELDAIQRLWRKRQIRYCDACKRELSIIEHECGRVLNIGLVADVSPWYQKASLVIFPVKKVHQARPIYEAGLFQKAVIVPDYENYHDSLKDGYNGLRYQRNNVDDMANKILMLIQNEDLLQKMGRNNHQMYLDGHTYYVVRRKLRDFIQAVVDEKKN